MTTETSLIYFGCIVVAVILHEISHGLVALWFGDDTAKRAGRLTLNPLPHLDPFGSIILPALGAITGIPVIAWAKPVPVNPNLMRNPRRDMLWVGLVGPFTNFTLMAGAALIARSVYQGITPASWWTLTDYPVGFQIIFYFALVNLFLGVFNLLPIPPLDGSALLERALPDRWLPIWYRFRPYGMLVLMLLVFTGGILGSIIAPFEAALVRFIGS